jgi:uncharacterized protein involved in cysteine biosynthesis
VKFALMGIRMVLFQKGYKRYLLMPLGISFGIYFFALLLGILFLVPRISDWLELALLPAAVADFIGVLIVIAAVVLFAWASLLAVTAMISPWFWDALTKKVEFMATGIEPKLNAHFTTVVGDLLLRLVFSIFVLIAILFFGWSCFGITGALLLGLLCLYDATAAALMRRGVFFRKQLFSVWKIPQAPLFMLTAAGIALIPIFNVLLLPGFIAGGTLMVVDHDSKTATRTRNGHH